ncbi:MAG: hypothetical protein HYV28_15300 [Ignavibacteriales bacterium]|nr:hypothetical protein [Ignavibacteriales bacterium]
MLAVLCCFVATENTSKERFTKPPYMQHYTFTKSAAKPGRLCEALLRATLISQH